MEKLVLGQFGEFDLIKFIKTVYDLSMPQGMGFLHFIPKPLTDDEANNCIKDVKDQSDIAVNMDYVIGRSCKMVVFLEDNKDLVIRIPWYDHTDMQLKKLLDTMKVSYNEKDFEEHGISCNCHTCRQKR